MAPMGEYQETRDGNIAVRLDDGTCYFDTVENFVKDGGPRPEALPFDCNERIYTQGKRHALLKDSNVIDGGPREWPEGDAIIADCMSYITAQTARKDEELKKQQEEFKRQMQS
jgi:hypothetical protein